MKPTNFLLKPYASALRLSAVLAAIVVSGVAMQSDPVSTTLTEMLIRMTMVIGLYIFVGNSGITSFGHVGFSCIGAYAAAWATTEPSFKQIMLQGLPGFLRDEQYSFPVAISGAALLPAAVALLLGGAIMRLSGIAASIATFAFLIIVNSLYSNWDSVTAGASSIIGIPTVVGPWVGLLFAVIAIAIAQFFQTSRFGLMLRASRDDEVAARAGGVNVTRVRLIGFVVSAAVAGAGGGLYAQFLGILTIDTFYLNLTFITIAMLVVGGTGSLAGAVSGVLLVTIVVEILRFFERGFSIGSSSVALPHGTQEIGLGLILALVLVLRPTGLTRSKEWLWPGRRAGGHALLGKEPPATDAIASAAVPSVPEASK